MPKLEKESNLAELEEIKNTGFCPVMTTLGIIGGKWKPGILWVLQQNGLLRFGAQKVLS